MLETSARLLRLLSLLQTRRDWPGQDLAERLGVGVRTVRRDVEKLRSLGYPVQATSGVAGGYRLGAGAALPPLLLDDDEAVAVAVGLRTAAGGTVSGLEETSLRALAKLEQVLPKRLRHRVHALQAVTVRLADGGPTVDPDVLVTAAGACRDLERLRFAYRDHDGTASRRTVEPHRLVHAGRRWYLVAWDVGRKDWRTFRVDRMAGRPTTGTRFVPRPPPPDLADYVARGVSTAPYRFQARVTLHAQLEEVAPRISFASGILESLDARSCTFTCGADSLEAFGWLVGHLGVEFEVHDPPELRTHLATLAARLNRAATG